MSNKKIGILGGTFNPIHNGHISIAEFAKKELNLDEIWFVPTFQTPLKDQPYEITPNDRFQMVKRAVKKFPSFKVKKIEILSNEISYTYKTVKTLKENYPNNEFFLLMGDDSFNNFDKWKNYKQIAKNINLVVFKRTNINNDKLLKEFNPILLNNNIYKISSTMIRSGYFSEVTKKVQKYITSNNLYLNEIVKNDLSEKRWNHTLSVIEWATEIAAGNKYDQRKAYYAALMHDMAKEWNLESSKKLIEKFNYANVEHLNERVIHGYAASCWWVNIYKSSDKKIANAIKYHTTATERMTKLAKIIFVADKIADNRDYENITWIREVAKVDINMAFSELLKLQYVYIKEKYGIREIDKNTIKA